MTKDKLTDADIARERSAMPGRVNNPLPGDWHDLQHAREDIHRQYAAGLITADERDMKLAECAYKSGLPT